VRIQTALHRFQTNTLLRYKFGMLLRILCLMCQLLAPFRAHLATASRYQARDGFLGTLISKVARKIGRSKFNATLRALCWPVCACSGMSLHTPARASVSAAGKAALDDDEYAIAVMQQEIIQRTFVWACDLLTSRISVAVIYSPTTHSKCPDHVL
jgi:hypothetical protein